MREKKYTSLNRNSLDCVEGVVSPETGMLELCRHVVLQAKEDYYNPPQDVESLDYMAEIYPAEDFLRERGIIK